MDEYNNKLAFLDKSAADLMGYGNSVGYRMLYGKDQAGNMQAGWNGMNPEIAYNTGKINAKKYKKMTGKDAPDQKPTSTGGTTNKKDYASYYKNGRPVYNNSSSTNTTTGTDPGAYWTYRTNGR